MKRIALSLLIVAASCMASEKDAKPTTGYLVINPNDRAWYNLDGQRDLKKKLGIDCPNNEPIIFITVRNQEEKFNNSLPVYLESDDDMIEFPSVLPYSLLKDKKEGDIITIETEKYGTIALTCSQKSYYPDARFENQLAYTMKQFKKKPRVHIHRLDELEQEGVVVRSGKYSHTHGPNGYKFESTDSDDDSDSDSSSSSSGSTDFTDSE